MSNRSGHGALVRCPPASDKSGNGRLRASHGCPLGARFRAAAALRRLRDDRRAKCTASAPIAGARSSSSAIRAARPAGFRFRRPRRRAAARAWRSRRGSLGPAPRSLMTNCRAASPSASNMGARSRSPGPWRATWRRWSASGTIPLLVPVPLHRTRLWPRGFNQSALVAREISRRLGHRRRPFPDPPDQAHAAAEGHEPAATAQGRRRRVQGPRPALGRGTHDHPDRRRADDRKHRRGVRARR